jgi:hypothetical protein
MARARASKHGSASKARSYDRAFSFYRQRNKALLNASFSKQVA